MLRIAREAPHASERARHNAASHMMLRCLARAAREAREDAGVRQIHVAAQADREQSTIARFEDAVAWPRDPDAIIAAYAKCAGITPREIWERATELLHSRNRH